MALALAALACNEGYSQGDCDPGYLDVDGKCTLAVGQDCESNGDCLSDICVQPLEGDLFCSIFCELDDNCPIGFFCNLDIGGICFPGKRPPPCKDDADCEPCNQCQGGFCLTRPDCVPCAVDGDCQACERCEEDRTCVQVAGCTKCTLDLDCPPCEACSERLECQRRIGCTLCGSDDDCPGCYACDRGGCAPVEGCGTEACLNDSNCPSRTKCLFDDALGFSVCMPIGLPFGADCSRGGNPTCAEGVCVLDPEGSETCSRLCLSDDDCPVATSCLPDEDCEFACRSESRPPGAECKHDADCPQDRVCGLTPGDGAWEAECMLPLPCAGLPGDSCDPDGGRCTTGICTQQGYCSPVCEADFDCPVDFLCDTLSLPLPAGGSAPFFGCAPEELVLGEVGEPCPLGGADCKSGSCLVSPPGGPHPFCTLACEPGAAECPDGFECRPDPGGGEDDLCQPSTLGGDCTNDATCGAGQVCTLDPAGSTGCIEPLPDGAFPGEPCGTTGPCRNGLCLRQGLCGAVCATGDDCPPGFICDYYEVYLAGGTRAYARLCVPDPGSMMPCQREADCPDGESCGLVLNPWGTGLRGQCMPDGAGGEPGSDCSQGHDCRTGFCPATGACSELCVVDTDCAADFLCVAIWVTLWPGASFSANGCVAPTSGDLGDPCPGGAPECVSGVCLHPGGEEEPYCSRECVEDEDCSSVDGMLCLDDGSAILYCMFP